MHSFYLLSYDVVNIVYAHKLIFKNLLICFKIILVHFFKSIIIR